MADRQAVFAELDRFIETLDAPNRAGFGRDSKGLDVELDGISPPNGLINNDVGRFGRFGRSNATALPKNGSEISSASLTMGAIPRIECIENNRPNVQTVQNDELLHDSNELELDGLTPEPAGTRPNPPPGDVPQHRWEQFVADSHAVRTSGFAEQASALGWTEAELFGCDDKRPFARIDCMGLVWLLNGNRLIAITADAAIIETKSGGRATFRRRRTAA